MTGVVFLETLALLTLAGLWVDGRRRHRAVMARRPSVLRDRPMSELEREQ
jgi:hypothetical protein